MGAHSSRPYIEKLHIEIVVRLSDVAGLMVGPGTGRNRSTCGADLGVLREVATTKKGWACSRGSRGSEDPENVPAHDAHASALAVRLQHILVEPHGPTQLQRSNQHHVHRRCAGPYIQPQRLISCTRTRVRVTDGISLCASAEAEAPLTGPGCGLRSAGLPLRRPWSH